MVVGCLLYSPLGRQFLLDIYPMSFVFLPVEAIKDDTSPIPFHALTRPYTTGLYLQTSMMAGASLPPPFCFVSSPSCILVSCRGGVFDF